MAILGVQAVDVATGTGGISTSVAVPSGTTKVLMLLAAFSDSGISVTAATLNGATPDASHNLNGNNDGYGTWAREWRTPTSGSQTLAITFSALSVYEGVAFLVFLNEVVSTGWRDAKSAEGGSITMSTQSGDLAIVLDTRYGSPAPSNQSGYTSLGTASSGTTNVRLRYIEATTTSTGATPQDASFSIILGVVFEQAESGNPDAPQLATVDTGETFASTATGVAFTGTNLGADENERALYLVQGANEVEQPQGNGDDEGGTFDVSGFGLGGPLKYGVATTLKVVTAEGEHELAVTITPPSGWAYVDLGTLHAEESERITAVPDLESANQLRYETLGGLFEIFSDGTFLVDESIALTEWEADVEAFDSVWGAPGTQSHSEGGAGETGDLSAGAGLGASVAARAAARGAAAAGTGAGATFSAQAGAQGNVPAAAGFGASFSARVGAHASMTAGIGAATSQPARADTAAGLNVPASVAMVATALSQAAAAIQAGLAAGETWASHAATGAHLAAAGEFGASFQAATAGAEHGALAEGSMAGAAFTAAAHTISDLTHGASVGMVLAAIAQARGAMSAGASLTIAAAALVSAQGAVLAGSVHGEAWAGHAQAALDLAAAGEFGASFSAATQSAQQGAVGAGTAAAAQFTIAAQALAALTATSSFGAAIEALVESEAAMTAGATFGATFAWDGDDQILPPARATLTVEPRLRVLRVVPRASRVLRINPRVRSTRLH